MFLDYGLNTHNPAMGYPLGATVWRLVCCACVVTLFSRCSAAPFPLPVTQASPPVDWIAEYPGISEYISGIIDCIRNGGCGQLRANTSVDATVVPHTAIVTPSDLPAEVASSSDSNSFPSAMSAEVGTTATPTVSLENATTGVLASVTSLPTTPDLETDLYSLTSHSEGHGNIHEVSVDGKIGIITSASEGVVDTSESNKNSDPKSASIIDDDSNDDAMKGLSPSEKLLLQLLDRILMDKDYTSTD